MACSRARCSSRLGASPSTPEAAPGVLPRPFSPHPHRGQRSSRAPPEPRGARQPLAPYDALSIGALLFRAARRHSTGHLRGRWGVTMTRDKAWNHQGGQHEAFAVLRASTIPEPGQAILEEAQRGPCPGMVLRGSESRARLPPYCSPSRRHHVVLGSRHPVAIVATGIMPQPATEVCDTPVTGAVTGAAPFPAPRAGEGQRGTTRAVAIAPERG